MAKVLKVVKVASSSDPRSHYRREHPMNTDKCKIIDSWDSLRAFGIEALTGEACGLRMRLLCDLTESGREIIQRFFGGTVVVVNGSEWYGGSGDDPHVASIMLPRSVLEDLGAYCLAEAHPQAAIALCKDRTIRAIDDPEQLARFEAMNVIKRYWRRSKDPGSV